MTRKQKQAVLLGGMALLFVAMVVMSLASNGCIPIGKTNADGDVLVSGQNRCNINTASVEELEKVYGLDLETAIEIVAYREQNGRFERLEDLRVVPTVTEEQFMKAAAFLVCE